MPTEHPHFPRLNGITRLLRPLASMAGDLHPDERAYIGPMGQKRRAEFTAGRLLAREGLAQFGFDGVAVARSESRWPIWPSGVAGSISHCDEWVGVALASTDTFAGIGLDLEQAQRLKDKLIPRVLTRAERSRLRPTDDATVWFACKEAVYKAVNPNYGEFLEFADVEIQMTGNEFTATCRPHRKSATAISMGRGYIAVDEQLIQSLFLVHTWP